MKVSDARVLGERLANLLENGRGADAQSELSPVLARRTPFPALDRLGNVMGMVDRQRVDPLLDTLAVQGTEGGWVVIGSALATRIDHDLDAAMERCRRYVAQGAVWYAADILAERVPGPALVAHFHDTLPLLEPWRDDPIPWVRKAVAVAVHFWGKRSRGEDPQGATALLDLLEPMFEEWDLNAAKGVGWGLKTLGRLYPDTTAEWLHQQAIVRDRKHRAVVLRKAVTYLPVDLRDRVKRV